MSEPQLANEGNARVASLPSGGVPADPQSLAARVRSALGEADWCQRDPLTWIIVDLPPIAADAPAGWRCQVGLSLTGLVRSRAPLLVEDYRRLTALSQPHVGPVRDLAQTYERLRGYAEAHGWRLRPYWRIAVGAIATPDDHLLPEALVSVFLDR